MVNVDVPPLTIVRFPATSMSGPPVSIGRNPLWRSPGLESTAAETTKSSRLTERSDSVGANGDEPSSSHAAASTTNDNITIAR